MRPSPCASSGFPSSTPDRLLAGCRLLERRRSAQQSRCGGAATCLMWPCDYLPSAPRLSCTVDMLDIDPKRCPLPLLRVLSDIPD